MYSFLIADDHPLFREALMEVISSSFPGSCLLETADLASTLNTARQEDQLDLLLLDLKMPGMQGFQGLVEIKQQRPDLPVVMVSAEDSRTAVLEAMQAGAMGFISKASPRSELVRALQQLLAGQVYLPPSINQHVSSPTKASPPEPSPAIFEQLTRKQKKVLERMALGESNKQIAWHLNLAETTVKGHVTGILAKLGFKNRVQLALAAQKYFSSQQVVE
ncbi:response regulator [Marinospirillum perlucidum]|uniref:response regulator n=1 Tax=Marinospirillum perlucidum TaxID=1982602 RepID=UPI000DF45CE6|nr:response regulator transcription factor [Marinospirillum perlucidum]